MGQNRLSDKALHFLEEFSKRQVSESKLQPEMIAELSQAYRDSRLVLALGAGVSMGQKLPSWKMLLQKLMIRILPDGETLGMDDPLLLAELFVELFTPSPLIAARYVRQNLREKGLEMGFEDAVRDTIYSRLDMEDVSDTIKEIRQLCAAPGRSPNLDSVITYNYDDLIERTLGKSDVDIRYKTIYGDGMQASPFELPIYHVHGFLPAKEKLTEEHAITLSEDIYHQQYSAMYSWSNIVQINKFRDSVCLFIGSSFTDPNLRRLLDIAKRQKGTPSKHYAIKRRYKRKDLVKNLTTIMEHKEADGAGGSSLDTDKVAELLATNMEGYEEKDAASFDVETVWVESFADISEILRKIREL